MSNQALSKNFGTYKPKGLNALTLKIVHLGLGRGKVKNHIAQYWKKHNPHTPVDIIYHGLKLRLQPQSNTIEKKILFSSKLREAIELKYLKSVLSNESVFLDIGANFGYYSLMAAKMGAGKVISVEPNPTLNNRLKEIAELNGYENIIHTNCLGLSDSESTLELTLNSTDLGSSSMADPDMDGEKIQVPVSTLSKLLKDRNIQSIDAMKIDVEGMEDRVLFSFFETSTPSLFPKLIIIEENAELWQRNILQWLLNNGYKTAHQSRGNYILKRVDSTPYPCGSGKKFKQCHGKVS